MSTNTEMQIVLAFIPPIITLIGAFIVLAIRDIWLNNKNIKQKNERDIIEKKLMYLYSPLFSNLQIGKERLGKRSLFTSKSSGEAGEGQYKRFIDETIEKYFFLASKRLQPYLAKVHGPGFYHIKSEDAEKLMDYLEEDYNELTRRYYSFK